MTDIHAHLFDCGDEELKAVVDAAVTAGIGTIINTAVSIYTARTVICQCGRFPQTLRAAAGISPFDTAGAEDGWPIQLRELLSDPMTAALGEIGLDCTNPRYPPLDVQMPFFVKQLEIAADTGLPAVIHSRGMERRTAEICHQQGVKKAVFHCFTGDRPALEYIINCGYYVSVSGIITYKNSHLREIIGHIPVDKLLIETDTPYLSPVPHRGKPNQPSYIIHTVRETARLLAMDDGELTALLAGNVNTLFGIEG
ncbi:MAG: TatD family hydrolase [Chitinispirillia bacterium]|nr:TatD family hydrolase [Chitinispirillia bacterium]MCL2240956.1 TatD family hydrolase [Chitinispirillia bacterium]